MAKKEITVLGIETSCDETAAAVVRFDPASVCRLADYGGQAAGFKVLSGIMASQIGLHKLTGGVVPEVAAREHVTTIMPTIALALKRAGILNSSLLIVNQKLKIKNQKSIDAIAVTAGPGLLPALMVGVDTANALSLATGIPVIPVQHITGHIYANFLTDPKLRMHPNTLKKKLGSLGFNSDYSGRADVTKIKFPLLALVVSGGHTEFIKMSDYLKFKKIGQTVDDAAGEAFDKIARVLGFAYPGGPEISKHALKGNSRSFNFPRPLLKDNSFNFSFAGLKTAVLYKVQNLEAELSGKPSERRRLSTQTANILQKQTVDDIAASAQMAIVDTLVGKTKQAIQKHKPKTFTLGGGVAANKLLRERLSQMLVSDFPEITHIPTQTQYATDNAAMIAAVGAMKIWTHQNSRKNLSGQEKEKQPQYAKTDPQWEI